MTFFTSQILLTVSEQITKYCLMFLTTNDRYCAASLTAVARHRPPVLSTRVPYIASHKPHSPVQPAVRRVKHTVTYISFVRECTVQFNTQDFLCGNLYKKLIVRECVAGNLEYVYPVFQRRQNQASLKGEEGHFQHLLYNAVCHTVYYVQKCKVVNP